MLAGPPPRSLYALRATAFGLSARLRRAAYRLTVGPNATNSNAPRAALSYFPTARRAAPLIEDMLSARGGPAVRR